MAATYDDLDGKVVADLGVGCGILSIGSVMLGASSILGVDIDEEALATAAQNKEEFEMNNIDLMMSDVRTLILSERLHNQFDTVVMNPPFGTKHNQGIDMVFLQAALKLSKTVS